ncbi:Crp/Fnr family transcriptional regulator [Fusobacterium sp.]|uniref:Crp/Fnr family transcriptional regulator n=1 Tax=Fusobacterium sp. TaxID=68766 RepID=UPI002628E709|nr:Crp/Fnr family transcriptional regulator [Fusobacterium sp.]
MTDRQKFFQKAFPFWDKISEEEQKIILDSSSLQKFSAEENIHDSTECTGILVVKSGLIRVYMLSSTGKEITLYKLNPYEVCALSASCILSNINFDIFVDAEKDSEVYLINPYKYKELKDKNIYIESFTNSVINQSFSDAMWIMEQILFMSFDKRLAIFLLEQSISSKSDVLTLTHDYIAKNMGTAREVVSRMLKYFQTEGIVSLSRGTVTIIDKSKLKKLL